MMTLLLILLSMVTLKSLLDRPSLTRLTGLLRLWILGRLSLLRLMGRLLLRILGPLPSPGHQDPLSRPLGRPPLPATEPILLGLFTPRQAHIQVQLPQVQLQFCDAAIVNDGGKFVDEQRGDLAIAIAFPSLLSSSRSKFSSSVPLPAVASPGLVVMSAEWMSDQPRPAYLDGSAPGDFGFHPLGLGTVPENLEWFKES
ncbi:unnamed protein product [Linum tenue]|uniref:Uncharacterized protein n=1 Tax=Linum tenue TaxID=586396 RepID=A0AAV0Q426_9ROSI|nr:unnamed protein product [Linum tenue]